VVDEAVRGFNVGGPLARRVEDLALALSVLEGEPRAELPPITGISCVVNLKNGPIPVRKEVAETVMLAAGSLEAAGMKVTRTDSLPLDRLGFIYTALLRKYALSGIRNDLGGGSDYSMIRELLRGFTGKARISREALIVESYIRFGGRIGPLLGEDSFERLELHRNRILEAINEGVLLCPLLMTRPGRHGATYRPLTQIPYASPFNATGMPAAIVPVRWTENGLPLAVQVVARTGLWWLAHGGGQIDESGGMTDTKTMTYEVGDRVARITLNRPDRGNGITRSLVSELEQCVERADLDPEIHAILLSGNGMEKGSAVGTTWLNRPKAKGDRGRRQRHRPVPLSTPPSWVRITIRPALGIRWSITR